MPKQPRRTGPRVPWIVGALVILGLSVATVVWLGNDPEPTPLPAGPVVAVELPTPPSPPESRGQAMPLLARDPPPEPVPESELGAVELHNALLSMFVAGADDPEQALTLIVVDAASQPVPDARVEVWSRANELFGADSEPSAVHFSDGRGRCELELPARRGLIFASKPGFGTSGLWSWRGLLRQLSEDGEALVMLQPTASLRGRVVHADEGPACGVPLMFAPRTSAGAGEGRVPRGRTFTDGDGRFEVTLDAGARLNLVAVDGDLTSHEQAIDASPGAELDVLVRFPGRWSIDGVLRDPEGEVVAGGSVTLWRHFPGYDVLGGERPEARPHRDETGTGPDGRFSFAVPLPGEYILIGQADDTPPGRSEIAFVDDALPRAELTLSLVPTAAIAGRLLAANGLPIPDVTITARPAHLYEPAAFAYSPTVWGLYGEASAVTDEEGRFELSPLHPEGLYIVFCRPDEALRDQKLVVKDVRPDGRELQLVATADELRRGWVAGVVLSDATGLPVAEFVPILVIELDGRVIDTEQAPVSSADGSFRVEGLAPGYRYALRIDAPGHGTVELPWFTASHRGQRVTARLPAVGSLVVSVTDPRGRTVELAEVTIQREAQIAGRRGQRSAHTDELGRVRFPDLPPGSYRVTARHGGQGNETSVQVTGAEESTASVELPR